MTISMIPNRDAEGNVLYRNVLAENNMLFSGRTFDFKTGKYGSLCNKNSEGIDFGDASILFFDSSRVELIKGESESIEDFQIRLDANCKYTWLYFTPTKRYAINKGYVLYKGTPSGEFDTWFEVAPHIPKAYGGSVAFLDGGLALDLFPESTLIAIDGGNCAIIEIDEINYSHRLGIKVEHEIGDKVDIIAIFSIYV